MENEFEFLPLRATRVRAHGRRECDPVAKTASGRAVSASSLGDDAPGWRQCKSAAEMN